MPFEEGLTVARQRDDGRRPAVEDLGVELDETGFSKVVEIPVPSIALPVSLDILSVHDAERANRRQGADLRRAQVVLAVANPDAFSRVAARQLELLRQDVPD